MDVRQVLRHAQLCTFAICVPLNSYMVRNNLSQLHFSEVYELLSIEHFRLDLTNCLREKSQDLVVSILLTAFLFSNSTGLAILRLIDAESAKQLPSLSVPRMHFLPWVLLAGRIGS